MNKTLMAQFVREIMQVSLEDGVGHPAEQTLKELIDQDGLHETITWLIWACGCYEGLERWEMQAAILRIIARSEQMRSNTYLVHLAKYLLDSGDVSSKEASVRLFESWNLKESVPWIREALAVEGTPWLKEYMERVIEDMEPTVHVPKLQPVYVLFSRSRAYGPWQYLDVFSTLKDAKNRITFDPLDKGWVKDGTEWSAMDDTGSWRIVQQFIQH